MKKLFALMLALCLLGSVAMAETTLVWEGDVATAASQYEGTFHTFGQIAVKIWIPADYAEQELTQEDIDNGFIGYFANEEASFTIVYVNVEGMTLDEYKAELESDSEVSEIEAGTVNDLPCISYKYKNAGSLAFTTQMGYILEISYGPIGNDIPEKAAYAFASIQAAE